MIFNVENAISTLGGNALEALKTIPGVRIQGEEIKLAGKNTVRIMVNDKIIQLSNDELQNYLTSIPSSNIQKIEVITNPPAKYDAEGNSGLINIQLKKAKLDNWNTPLRSSYQQATYESISHGIGFSYSKNKLSTLADLSYLHSRNIYTNNIHYYYPLEKWNNHIFYRNHRKNLSALLNLQYDLAKKSRMGMRFLGSFSNNLSDEYYDSYSYYHTGQILLKHDYTEGKPYLKPQNIALNINYNQKLNEKGEKFSIDADYFHNVSPKKNEFISDLMNFEQKKNDKEYAFNNSNQSIKNYSLKTDFEFPYNWANILFGAKISATKTDNSLETNLYKKTDNSLISAQNDHFQYTENMQALYFNISKSLKKWEIQAGFRGGNTQTKAHSISGDELTERNYFKLFPTLYLLYRENDRHIFFSKFWKKNRPAWILGTKSCKTLQ
nr:TonB-dependent receptor [Elizabethkingia argenteiflava]